MQEKAQGATHRKAARRVRSLRRRVRHVSRVYGAGVSRYVGNHPFFAGMAGTLVAVAMAGLTLLTLNAGRADALDHAHETAANLVSIVSSDLERNVEIYDLSLQAMVDGAEHADTWTLPADLRRAVLFDRATTAAYLGGAYVVGADGRVIASQNDDVNPAVSLIDRDYFVVHQRSPAVGLYVSHPFHSRLRDGKLSIGLTRRVNAPDGTFRGIALLAIRIEYFQRLLDRISTGQSGSVFIVLDDGTMLARKPFAERDIGASIARSRTFEVMAEHASGSYVATSAVDGVQRIFTYARVPGTPLIAVVAPAVDDVLGPWRRRSLLAGGLTAAFGAVFVVVSWLLAFALRDKLRAQADLMRLAATDPLTGLFNRRVLDNGLDEEWRRARRTGRPLTVLFIDIDHFKQFNDVHGHATGDEVLITVAECIASVVRRSIDLVARYGGEEFAVVLPEIPVRGAYQVAEKIRRKVQDTRLVLAHGETATVTVSIGCASCVPADSESALELLAAADNLLYAAKAAGRNQVKSSMRAGVSVPQD